MKFLPLTFALLTTSALAAPRITPTQDVTVDYIVAPKGHAPLDVQVEIEAFARHLRITSPDLPTAFLIDRTTETATIVLPLLKLFATSPIGRYDPERTTLQNARFERGPTHHRAGLACTDWHAASPHGQATACITDTGVILDAAATGDNGPLGTLHATRVRYAPLPPLLFQLPDGYKNAGTLPAGLGIPGAGR